MENLYLSVGGKQVLPIFDRKSGELKKIRLHVNKTMELLENKVVNDFSTIQTVILLSMNGKKTKVPVSMKQEKEQLLGTIRSKRNIEFFVQEGVKIRESDINRMRRFR
ncbi:TPA: hypothetical protein I0I20_RS09210 [Enterococcus faecium]